MPTFSNKKFHPSSAASTIGVRYRSGLSRHPFLFFGLPFIATILAGSFFLTPATALRYETHDRKVQRVSQEEAMGLGKDRRKVNMNEEYYVSELAHEISGGAERLSYSKLSSEGLRLSMKDIDNWEQKRVDRLKGEPDGKL